ncbi:related to MFS monocarboxylate transporter [Cephalotrichum gorgonifer]|uniref:Related to MFS monocarboxylate transporter n=1 Tax=Cephalotrichum gorgonifer TaxID=2041049 RepID=A0AAE8N7D8_9PEZI|nr:related to MFS monocarboxylate transporter [Cephalotrichum gorgonifer]
MLYDEKDASSAEGTRGYLSTPTDSQSVTIAEVSNKSASQLDDTLRYIAYTLGRGPAPDLESKLPQTAGPIAAEEQKEPTNGIPDDIPDDIIPDGGLTAWLQVLGSWVIAVVTWGVVNSYGVFQTYYVRELLPHRSASDLSWVGSLQAALLMIIGVIAGPAYDSGYFRHLLWAGLALILFGQFMTSLCSTYWQVVLAQGVCMGTGCGFVFLPSTAILSQYFKRKRGLVIGIASTGSPVASIIFPILFGRLQPKIGFPWATRVLAFLMLGLSVVPVLFMRMRVPPSGVKRSLLDRSAFRDVPYLLCAAGCFLAFLTIYVGFFYIQSFAIRFDITTPDFSPYLVTLLGAGSIVGRVGPNHLADKFGALNIVSLAGLISGVLCFAWMGIRNLGGMIAFALLYGASSGGLVSVMPTAVVSLSPDLSLVGTRLGMLFFTTGIAVVVGPPIAGAIISSGENAAWMGAIGYSATGLFLGGLTLAASRLAQYRQTGSWIG